MWQNKLDRVVEEFCDIGKLQDYREIIIDIFVKIDNAGCKISTRFDDYSSRHLFEKDNCFIQISFKRSFENSIDIIWTILHEFGHHLSGRISKEDEADVIKKYTREELAWDYARKELNNYPQLLLKLEEFEKYRIHCLEGYLNLKNNS